MKEITCCPKCGCKEFIGHQVCHMEVVVDGNGVWLRSVKRGIYQADKPFAPFTCKRCGNEFSSLPIEVSDEWEKPTKEHAR